jgi:lysophospholipase L1-like esterase
MEGSEPTAGPADLLRGLDTNGGRSRIWSDYQDMVPHDTWATSLVSSGAHLRFSTACERISVTYDGAAELHPLAPPFERSGFSLWGHGKPLAHAGVQEGRHEVTIPLGGPAGTFDLYLPEARSVSVAGLAGVEGELTASPPRLRWLAYGDSITQGWSATDPGLTYVGNVARDLELEAVNLGFAGSARGELPVARQIADMPASVISLAFGTNCWTRPPMGSGHVAGVLRDFVATVRSGHRSTPIVVLTPIARPDAEDAPNLVGATLKDIRAALESTVLDLMGSDPNLQLVAGASLVRPAQLVDGIHPDDEGHRAMADCLGEAFSSALKRTL